jgi:hypothetical protein
MVFLLVSPVPRAEPGARRFCYLTTNLTNLTNTQVVIPESREADSSGIYFNRLAE